MKNIVTNKLFIAGAIVAVAVGVWYVSTWMNKDWLIERIVFKGGVENTEENWKALEMKTISELKKQLKSLS